MKKVNKLAATMVAVILAVLMVACGTNSTSSVNEEPAVPDDPVSGSGQIVIGVISTDPTDAITEKQPLADYLAANLGGHAISSGLVKVTPDMEIMGQWMANGEVDIFLDSFYPTAVVSAISGASPIAYRQRDKSDKRAVFFASIDSGINTLDDLLGQNIVLEEPDSTSGFLLPLFYLLEAGYKLVENQNPDDPVGADEIGYVFSGDDEAVVQWVLTDKIEAGVAQDNTFADFDEENPGALVILLTTEPIIRDQPVLLRAGLDAALQQSIGNLFLNMGNSDVGRALLEELETARFAQLDGQREVDRARAQEMFDLVQENQ